MGLVSGVIFLGTNCGGADDIKFTPQTIQADITLSGSSTQPGAFTVNGTLTGGGTVTWDRDTGFYDIVHNIVASDAFIVGRNCCQPSLIGKFLLGADDTDTGERILPSAATIDCTCIGLPCTGYPKHEVYDFRIKLGVLGNDDPFDPLYKYLVQAQIGTIADTLCAFGPVRTFDGETDFMTIEDLNTAPITITIDNSSDGGNITDTLVVEITYP